MQNGYETLRVSAIRGSEHVWPGKLKRPPLSSGVRHRIWNIQSEDLDMSDRGSWNVLLFHPDMKYPEKVKRRPDRIPDVRYPARRKGDRLRVQGVGTPPPSDTERTSLSRATPSRFPKSTRGALPYLDSLREKHTTLVNTTLRTIAYPIRICCPDHWLMWASLATSFRQPATTHIPPPSDGVSGRPVRTSLPWIPKNSPQSRIALVIKKLSKHQNLTQFD